MGLPLCAANYNSFPLGATSKICR